MLIVRQNPTMFPGWMSESSMFLRVSAHFCYKFQLEFPRVNTLNEAISESQGYINVLPQNSRAAYSPPGVSH